MFIRHGLAIYDVINSGFVSGLKVSPEPEPVFLLRITFGAHSLTVYIQSNLPRAIQEKL